MARRQRTTYKPLEFTPNKHILVAGIGLMIMTIALVVYDYSIGETIFGGAEVSVLGDQATPTVTPYITPTNSPR